MMATHKRDAKTAFDEAPGGGSGGGTAGDGPIASFCQGSVPDPTGRQAAGSSSTPDGPDAKRPRTVATVTVTATDTTASATATATLGASTQPPEQLPADGAAKAPDIDAPMSVADAPAATAATTTTMTTTAAEFDDSAPELESKIVRLQQEKEMLMGIMQEARNRGSIEAVRADGGPNVQAVVEYIKTVIRIKEDGPARRVVLAAAPADQQAKFKCIPRGLVGPALTALGVHFPFRRVAGGPQTDQLLARLCASRVVVSWPTSAPPALAGGTSKGPRPLGSFPFGLFGLRPNPKDRALGLGVETKSQQPRLNGHHQLPLTGSGSGSEPRKKLGMVPPPACPTKTNATLAKAKSQPEERNGPEVVVQRNARAVRDGLDLLDHYQEEQRMQARSKPSDETDIGSVVSMLICWSMPYQPTGEDATEKAMEQWERERECAAAEGWRSRPGAELAAEALEDACAQGKALRDMLFGWESFDTWPVPAVYIKYLFEQYEARRVLDLETGLGSALLCLVIMQQQYRSHSQNPARALCTSRVERYMGFEPNPAFKRGHDGLAGLLDGACRATVVYDMLRSNTKFAPIERFDTALVCPPAYNKVAYHSPGSNVALPSTTFVEYGAWLVRYLFVSTHKMWSILDVGGCLIGLFNVASTTTPSIMQLWNRFVWRHLAGAQHARIVEFAEPPISSREAPPDGIRWVASVWHKLDHRIAVASGPVRAKQPAGSKALEPPDLGHWSFVGDELSRSELASEVGLMSQSRFGDPKR